MTNKNPSLKVGSAYQITLKKLDDDEHNLLLDRSQILDLSPKLKTLIAGPMFITASPGRPAVSIFSQRKWEEIRGMVERLPNHHTEVKQIQRRVLGHLTPYHKNEPLVMTGALAKHAQLSTDVILIAFNEDNAEIWDEQQLVLWPD